MNWIDHLETHLTQPTHNQPTQLLPHQQPPPTGWTGWALIGGRGTGKTYAGARWIGDLAATTPGLRARIIAPTLADAVNSVVEDPDSGIKVTHPKAILRTSGPEGTRVVFPNRATIWCVGTPTPRDVDRLRALTNIDADVFEEAAANPHIAEAKKQADLSRRGKRLPKPLWAAMTTPRPLAIIKEWLADESVAVTRATTFDNPHTPDAYRQYAEALRGTRMFKQEILGEVIDDIDGALWTLRDLERSAVDPTDRAALLDRLGKIVVGVDPPSGPGTCGIIVAGRDDDGHLYVLDDYSVTDATPHQWAMRVATAAADYGATVVAEVNQGGRMVKEVLRQAAPNLPLTTVNASRGKKTRAEPIALLWEAEHQTAHLAPASPDALVKLMDQMTEWVPGSFSPDRVDACVWACTHLLDRHEGVLHTPNRGHNTTAAVSPLTSALRGRL